jgi:putative heme-binding domain-containing protein
VERGDALVGKQLFQKHCGSCHRLFGEGEKVGPDLTNTSRNDTEYLLASLVDPSAVVRREYAASILVTTGGQVLTGLIIDQADGRVSLVDNKGQKQHIGRSEIAELRDAETSLMPEGLPLLFTPRELRDLFSYLQASPP